MDIRQLSYFSTIYEEASMTAASEVLHVSQPTLSNQLKALEDELGFTLFERKNRKLIPTEEGVLLYEHAKVLQNNYDSLLQTFSELKSGNYDVLHIGCICSLAILAFPPLMTSFLEQNPKCKIHVFENNTVPLLSLLDEGTIDLCIIKGQFNHSVYHHLSLDELFDTRGDCLSAVGLPSMLNVYSDSITFRSLENVPLILQRTHEAAITDAFQLYNITPNIMSSHENVISALSWSSYGMGVAIMPYSTTSLISHIPDGDKLVIKKLTSPTIDCQTSLIWRRDHKLNLSAHRFIEFIKKAISLNRHLAC